MVCIQRVEAISVFAYRAPSEIKIPQDHPSAGNSSGNIRHFTEESMLFFTQSRRINLRYREWHVISKQGEASSEGVEEFNDRGEATDSVIPSCENAA